MEPVTHEATVQAHPEQGPNVTVTVDGLQKTVHRGHIVVAAFKQEVGVEASKDLDEIINGELKPLQDTDSLVLKGGEVFISHARTGGSSSHGRR
jgi:hypothetical protein